jgi:hypothetical protein
MKRQIHAVHRRSIDGVDVRLEAVDAQRVIEADGMRGGAALAIRGGQDHLADILQRARQRLDARRADAVVVAEKNKRLHRSRHEDPGRVPKPSRDG